MCDNTYIIQYTDHKTNCVINLLPVSLTSVILATGGDRVKILQRNTFRVFKKLVWRADMSRELTCYKANPWNMISQKSEQEENLPPAGEHSHRC